MAVAPPNGLRCLFDKDVFMELTFPVVDLRGRLAAVTSAGIVSFLKRQSYIHEKSALASPFCAQLPRNRSFFQTG
jgi:hypothetical protein